MTTSIRTTLTQVALTAAVISTLALVAVNDAQSNHRAALAVTAEQNRRGDVAADDLNDAASRLSSKQYLNWKQSVRARHEDAASK